MLFATLSTRVLNICVLSYVAAIHASSQHLAGPTPVEPAPPTLPCSAPAPSPSPSPSDTRSSAASPAAS